MYIFLISHRKTNVISNITFTLYSKIAKLCVTVELYSTVHFRSINK